MKTTGFAIFAASLAVVGAALVARPAYRQAPSDQIIPTVHHGAPVLVELYQSQGCSSCPPANANLNAIAGRPDIVALSFGVTYWDQLGWKDTFASPQFTQRQWDYASYNRRGNVATPQIWVNGRVTIVGNDPRQLAATIDGADGHGPALALNGDQVRIGALAAGREGADLWMARYDPRVVQVPIRAGENGGRTLPHRNIVRQLVRVGHWTGAAMTFALPSGPAGLSTAVFLQAGRGGPILAAAKEG